MTDASSLSPLESSVGTREEELLGVPSRRVTAALFLVVVFSGAVLQQIYAVSNLLTLSSLMALSWLLIAPLLVQDAIRLTRSLLTAYQLRFRDEETATRLFERFFENWRHGWRVFSIVWAIVVTGVIVAGQYWQAPLPIKIWAVAAYLPLMMISGIGFRGIVVLIWLVRDFVEAGVEYQPFHPDRFGGLAAVGSYAVRGALYFSSGALVLPLAFEIIGLTQGDARVSAVAYVVTAIFIGFVCAAFAVPITDVKRLADAERVRVSLESRSQLEALKKAYRDAPGHDEKLSREVDMCFYMECAEIDKLREYPYDLSVVAELMLAVAVPVAVVVFQQMLK